ncbi:MAG: peroxidase family protein [Erythrobacter sp.]
MSNPEHHGMKALEGLNPYCSMRLYGEEHLEGPREDRFGRMFPHLHPAYTSPEILRTIGEVDGEMDSKTIVNRTNDVAAGLIFFGQFVDHDITLDVSTTFDSVIDDPGEISNVRTPTLDLDCIYGLGPEAQPYLYVDGGDFGGVKLLTGADNPGQAGENDHDVLRSPNGRAIIGDPRNDENLIISQLQLAMIRFHNHVADTLHGETGMTGHDLYEAARRQTTWHYQWGLVNDFLTAICGRPVVERILGCGREHYCGGVPYIPVEFSVAAYRFGHSMIPRDVQVRKGGDRFDLFGTEFGPGFGAITDPATVVDWHELLVSDQNASRDKADKLDTKLVTILLDLPFVNGPAEDKSLATRNLRRGNAFLLPAGEKVAEAVGTSQAHIDATLDKVEDINADLGRDGIPLWLYLLAEAEVVGRAESDGSFTPGEGLGPTGATIVAEVLIGLLELDDHSYLGTNRDFVPRPEWNSLGNLVTVAQPTLPAI